MGVCVKEIRHEHYSIFGRYGLYSPLRQHTKNAIMFMSYFLHTNTHAVLPRTHRGEDHDRQRSDPQPPPHLSFFYIHTSQTPNGKHHPHFPNTQWKTHSPHSCQPSPPSSPS